MNSLINNKIREKNIYHNSLSYKINILHQQKRRGSYWETWLSKNK